jgi:hypothetical protein
MDLNRCEHEIYVGQKRYKRLQIEEKKWIETKRVTTEGSRERMKINLAAATDH